MTTRQPSVRFFLVLALALLACLSPMAWALRKNVADQTICAQLYTTTGGQHTSGTTTVYYHDNGSQATGSTATHLGNGTWCYTPTQAETNRDFFAFTFHNNSSLALDWLVQGYTTEAQTGDSYGYLSSHLTGTVLTGSHNPQSGDAYAYVAGHLNGSLGAGMHSAQDPWATAIPGAYGAGTAGLKLGNILSDLATAHGPGPWVK